MSNFFKHKVKDNLKKNVKKNVKKVVRASLGGPATVAYEFFASASPLNDYHYSQEELQRLYHLSYMANAPRMKMPKKMPDSLKRKMKKNKKGPR